MKWISHKAVTGVSILALTSNPLFSLISMAGSVFPDKIEYFLFPNNWKKHHRKTSHWFIPYLLFFSFLYFILIKENLMIFKYIDFIVLLKSFNINAYLILFLNFFFWFILGSLFHILEDAFCGGIPVLNPSKLIHFPRLFYVGSLKEYIFTLSFCLLILHYKFDLIYLYNQLSSFLTSIFSF